MLIAILTMIFQAGTADVKLLTHDFPVGCSHGCGWRFCVFRRKDSLWPVHLAARRPRGGATAGSVILAGVLLKFGGYGFLRFSLPMFPIASADFTPFVFGLSVIAIIYTSLVALAQEDMAVTYSSVAYGI